MDVSTDELCKVFQELYPEQFKVGVLTVVNRKQAELINQLTEEESK